MSMSLQLLQSFSITSNLYMSHLFPTSKDCKVYHRSQLEHPYYTLAVTQSCTQHKFSVTLAAMHCVQTTPAPSTKSAVEKPPRHSKTIIERLLFTLYKPIDSDICYLCGRYFYPQILVNERPL